MPKFQDNPRTSDSSQTPSLMANFSLERPDSYGGMGLDVALTGAQKSAILLIAMGVDQASAVLRLLRDDEVERITVEIARFRNVGADVVEAVLLEYRDMKMAQNYIAQGGSSYARTILVNALGERRADEIMMRVEAAMEVSAFHLLQTVETSQLQNFLINEHPQTAALILAHLNARKAADILNGLPPSMQIDIMMRLATMNKTSPELMRDIEEVIRIQIGSVFGGELSKAGGIEKVAEILNNSSRSVERNIMEEIRQKDADMAMQIKGLMFTFDDLVGISGRDIQRLLMDVEQKDLALGLKAASEDLKQKVFGNVSERVANAIREEMELLGAVRVTDVDEAQRRVLAAAQRLEEEEEISLTRGGGDMIP